MISSIANTASTASTVGTSDPTDFIQKMFDKADADGDGKVTQDEFAAAMEKRLGAAQNGTNAPDSTEIFNSVDTDGDGSITASEFETAFKSMKAQGQEPPPPPPGPPPGASEEDVTEMFNSLDTDQDGTVSLAELQAALMPPESSESDASTDGIDASAATQRAADLEELFESIDTDGDGSISESEFQTMMEKMEENRPPPPPHGFDLYSPDGSSSSAADGSFSVLEVQV